MNNNKIQERGQIIVLLAVSLVVVMMVAALAVDGGMIYSERRFAQNASDAASLAGGSEVMYAEIENKTFECPVSSSYNNSTKQFTVNNDIKLDLIGNAYKAARNVATINNVNNFPFLGYKINGVIKEDYGINENHGVIIECNDNNEDGRKTINIISQVTSQVSTAFAHLLYPGELKTTNEAIATVYLGDSGKLGNAIISLSKNCKSGNKGDGLFMSGSATVIIHGGGAHTNSCLVVNGLGNGLVIDSDGGLNVYGVDVNLNGGTLDDINLNQGTEADPAPTKPTCPVYNTTTKWKDVKEEDYDDIQPGKYESVSITNGDTVVFKAGDYVFTKGVDITGGNVTFEPGLYCIDSFGLKITGGTINGEGITFYVAGGVDLVGTGNSNKDLPDITFSPPIAGPYAGLLFYVDGGETGIFKIAGNNESYFSGMIYVPDSTISIGGSSEDQTCEFIPDTNTCEGVTFSSIFVGNQVEISGDGNIEILYNGGNDPAFNSSMELKK